MMRRIAERGFGPCRCSAEHGFGSCGRSAEHGFGSCRCSAEHGFTLVEVMVALLIFGMIAGAGVALLSTSIRAQAATAARLDDSGAVARLSSLLAADFAQAVDRPARDERGNLLPAFQGDGASVRLVRGGWENVDDAPRASLQKVEYRLAGDTLERIAWPMLDGAAPMAPMAALGGIAGVTWRYRYLGAWSERWDGAGGAALPQVAELTVVRRDGQRLRQMFLVGAGVARPVALTDSDAR